MYIPFFLPLHGTRLFFLLFYSFVLSAFRLSDGRLLLFLYVLSIYEYVYALFFLASDCGRLYGKIEKYIK